MNRLVRLSYAFKAFIIVFLLVVAALIAISSQISVEKADGWILGDWLINYDGGFVRRGLTGTVILWFSNMTSFSPLRIANTLQIALYFLTALIFFVLVSRRTLELWFILFIFSPATFLFPLLDRGGTGHKEILYFVLLAAWCLYLDRREKFSLKAGLAFTLLTALLILSHEGMVFFISFFPAAYILFKRMKGQRLFAGQAFVIPVAALVIFALVAMFGRMTEYH
jgi:hypothetical protein